MIVTCKLLKDAIDAQRDNEKTTRAKWLMLAAWKTLIYYHYGFGSGLDFNIQQLKKRLAFFGVQFLRKYPLEMILECIPAAKSGLGKTMNVRFYSSMSSSNKSTPSEPTTTF
jgi:hypothetical protein